MVKDKFGIGFLVGDWYIDLRSGVQYFADYLSKLELLDSGASIAEVFAEEKKKSGKVRAIFTTDNKTVVVDDLMSIQSSAIAELSFSGVMRNSDGLCSYGVESLSRQLQAAYDNPEIKGVLLNINSGGGESSAGYTLQSAIADRNKPVVVRSSLAASAALNGILPADEIIGASENAEFGSIGTYIPVHLPTLETIKKEMKFIYSSTSPNKNSEFRKAIDGDFSGLEAMATKNAAIFQQAVLKYLQLPEDTAQETLSGGMFYAQDAKQRGLVHSVGTRNFALKRIYSHIKYFKNEVL